jgi:hypothetical protein
LLIKKIKKNYEVNSSLTVEFNKDFYDIHCDKYSVEVPVRRFQKIRSPYAKRLYEILFKSYRGINHDLGFPIKIKKLAEKIPFASKTRPSQIVKVAYKSVEKINKVLRSSKSKFKYEIDEYDKVLQFHQVYQVDENV